MAPIGAFHRLKEPKIKRFVLESVRFVRFIDVALWLHSTVDNLILVLTFGVGGAKQGCEAVANIV